MKDTIEYLISFLLYGHEDATKLVGYTRNEEDAKNFSINIVPSENSPLYNPQKTWADFMPEVERALSERSLTAETDILSIACFFLSRAEETVVTERDEHDRFLAEHSLVGKHQLLSIPLIDEYGRQLLKQLGLPQPEQRFSHVNLTHDVDVLEQYRHLRGFLGGLKRGEWQQAFAALHHLEADPAWTFPWLKEQDKGFHTIYFLKAGSGKGYDNPQYDLYGKDMQQLLSLLKAQNSEIGLHLSYEASERRGTLIKKEKETLEKAIGKEITKNRYHYLRTQSIDNMQRLADSGITDDYSMGFADQAGFRLLTSRAVRWINPKSLQLTSLTLHPLLAMDCTLSNSQYMNLTEDEAYYTCLQLIDRCRHNNGEVNLLWHNNNLVQPSYHRSLYPQIVDYLGQ